MWGSLRSRKPAIKWLVEVISLLDNRLRGNESVAVFPGGNWTRTTPQPTVTPSLSSSPHGNYCEALELRHRTPVSLKCGEQKGGDETLSASEKCMATLHGMHSSVVGCVSSAICTGLQIPLYI